MLAFLLFAAPLQAQPDAPSAPTVGLVLSGGGARGFAHVGAMQVIEEVGVPVDVVAGTSIGSVIGALYAMGFDADSLAALVQSEDWSRLLTDTPLNQAEPLERRVLENKVLLSLPLSESGFELPANLVAGQEISMTLSRLLLSAYAVREFGALPRPFAAVATDLETGEGVRFTSGYLPQIVQASIALPSLFAPVAVGERTFIDGGVVRNLPAEDARALGADVLVCVDVSEPVRPLDSLETFVDVLFQVNGFGMARSNEEQLALCDVVIDPKIEDISILSFDRADTLVARGRAAAEAVRPRLERLADSLRALGHQAQPPIPLEAQAVRIAHLEIEGLARPLGRRIERALALERPSDVTADDLADAVARVYDLGYFERVTFRLEPGADGATLVLQVREQTLRRLDLSARYSSAYRAALLLGLSLPDLVGPASVLDTEIRLGQALRLDVRLALPLSLATTRRLFLDAAATRLPLDLYDGDEIAVRFNVDALHLGARASLVLQNRMAVTAGVRAEWHHLVPVIGNTNPARRFLSEAEGLLMAEGTLVRNTLAPSSFPVRGYHVSARTFGAADAVGSSATFWQTLVTAEARWPVADRLSLIAEAQAGHTVGTPPLHYRFYLGGAYPHEVLPGRQLPLLGYRVYQLSGESVQRLTGGVQATLPYGWLATARYNVARVAENEAAFSLNDLHHGFGLSLGTRSFLGPVEVTLMTPSLDGPFSVRVNLGYLF